MILNPGTKGRGPLFVFEPDRGPCARHLGEGRGGDSGAENMHLTTASSKACRSSALTRKDIKSMLLTVRCRQPYGSRLFYRPVAANQFVSSLDGRYTGCTVSVT